VQAAVAVLAGRYRLSRREVAAICADLLGVDLAVGSVDGLCQDTAAALAEPMAELEAAVQQPVPVHADETHWRQAGKGYWLWVVVSAMATVFRIAPSRGSAVIKGLLGEDFAGWLTTDRYAAYTWVFVERRQVCWAHLKRDFQALVDRGGPGQPVGEAALALIERMFAAWHQARDDPALRPWLAEQMGPIQAEFRTLLETGQENRDRKTAGLCWSLLRLWPALWTFVTVPGVEPTNNRAEQTIRPAVLWRKGSFGNQNDNGARFVERMLSVGATCKQQRRSLLEYVTAVCCAAQAGHPIPLLLSAAAPAAHGA
jgi:transposase